MDLHEVHRLMAGKEPLIAGGADGSNPFLSLQHYEMFMVAASGGAAHHQLVGAPPSLMPAQSAMEGFGFTEEAVGGSGQGGGSGGGGRWPRQETLTLLEVRSRLDAKFREAVQKGPLWDEVSRIMAEEHGYRRSGKKCREKLDNLYKYYKKTKGGKAGRQDGKHYRFFRQLEALYGGGDTNGATLESKQRSCLHSTSASNLLPTQGITFPPTLTPTVLSQSLSLSNSSGCSESSSSTREDQELGVGSKRGRKSWSSKLKDLMDMQINRIIEVQEDWMNKMLKTLEHMEQERISREEAWRRQDAARLGREHSFWAAERAWVDSRNAKILEALEKIAKHDQPRSKILQEENSTSLMKLYDGSVDNNDINSHTEADVSRWREHEMASLIKLKNSMDSKLLLEGRSTKLEAMWEEIFAEMASLGYDQRSKMCKERWDHNHMNSSWRSSSKDRSNKDSKGKMTSSSCPYSSTDHKHIEETIYGERNGCEDNDQDFGAVHVHQDIHVYHRHSNYDDDAAGGGHRHTLLLPASEGDHKYLWEDHNINGIQGDQ